MNRIKVVNDISELVAVLRAVDSETKLSVFKEVMQEWKSKRQIQEKYGKSGEEALALLEKLKLVETRWTPADKGPEMSYHTFYKSFHINITCPISEISDILSAAMIGESKFEDFENTLDQMVGAEGVYVGDVLEKMGLTMTMLKGLVKRSSRFEYRGHRIERVAK
ncbi:MAG TPA: ArsR family transcriptional regulator [Thermoplasmata archaeon]|nr:ArsR family transcriptional regulator [Thermoplasmata archaeon]